MTNYESGKRMLTDNLDCPCGASLETVLHVFWDYVQARQLWDRVMPPILSHTFFTSGLRQWIVNNLKLWKQRNELVFTNVIHPTVSILHRNISWTKCYDSFSFIPYRHESRMVDQSWSKPPTGWLCLNSDGVVSSSAGEGSVGCVISDSDGGWIVGFNKNIDISSILQVELWGIYEGLIIARNSGHSRIIVQSDNSQVIKMFKEENSDRNQFPLIRASLRASA
ncbi:hypothetical protein F3Y22_tig00110694pilonHSYRG00302 [Hibiscus syriacus]|uniref:RNase H type-1 domain-containing protein n=1 Tax=Hibiscus syriacus TaxID=106335 RepID=A0A6A2ZUR8_HIBSY|nr:hypothetical protein F3Y22_tig00110694pilonHSYRG00302 [Hibiscus syriacus]